MNTNLLHSWLLRLLVGWIGCGSVSLQSAMNDSELAAQSINRLGLELLQPSRVSGGNQLLSPYSIQIALAMTWAGADGETRSEMARVLGFPEEGAKVHQSFRALMAALDEVCRNSEARVAKLSKQGAGGDPLSLSTANRLFGERHYPFRPEFLSIVQTNYGAPLELMSFREDPSGARQAINRWVAERTKDRIVDLVPPEGITRDSRLVLVNAIHFKSPWAQEFSASATTKRPFYVDGKASQEVPTLYRQGRLGYAKREGYSAVTLPYAGGELQFLILLPDEREGLAQVEASLSDEILASCASLPSTEVQLYLPKLKLQPPLFRLSAALKKMGMKSAFDLPVGSANFDRMAERKRDDYLFISEVFHKTFLALDEKGTEAAAATAVSMMRATSVIAPPKPPVEVKVDHPFLFAIQHRTSKACLFLGRLNDPR